MCVLLENSRGQAVIIDIFYIIMFMKNGGI